jgi:GT2 family glycosyltransferase
MRLKDFTIIIPCVSFGDVKNCIKNIRKNYKKIKIIVSLNRVGKKINKDKNLKIIISKNISIGKKRNIAVNVCNSKYIAFIDSDAYPGKNWIESAYKYINKKNIGIVAGPHVDPPKQSYKQMIVGLVKKSFLITMLPKLQKQNKEKAQYTSFIPSVNWIMSRKFFNSLNQMDNKMLRNEDWDFVYKMSQKKFKLLYSPNTLIYHDNNSISHFIKKRFIYGFYMWPILTKLNLQNYYFFLPLIFAIFLISFPLIFIINYYLLFYLIIISIYFFIVLWESTRLSKNLKTFFYVLFVLICGNISPGFGIFFGFFNFINNKV